MLSFAQRGCTSVTSLQRKGAVLARTVAHVPVLQNFPSSSALSAAWPWRGVLLNEPGPRTHTVLGAHREVHRASHRQAVVAHYVRDAHAGHTSSSSSSSAGSAPVRMKRSSAAGAYLPAPVDPCAGVSAESQPAPGRSSRSSTARRGKKASPAAAAVVVDAGGPSTAVLHAAHDVAHDVVVDVDPAGSSEGADAAGSVHAAQAAAAPAAHQDVSAIFTRATELISTRGHRLNSFQSSALLAVLEAWLLGGVNRQLVSMPTGAGKTVLMVALARALGTRTLIIVNRLPLIEQTSQRVAEWWPEVGRAGVGVVQAQTVEWDEQVVVAMVNTASQKAVIDELVKRNFGLIIVDEAHHSVANMWAKVLEGLGVLGADADESKLLLGVTATPYRHKLPAKQQRPLALGDVFLQLTYDVSIFEMQAAGKLAPAWAKRIATNTVLDVQSALGEGEAGGTQDFKMPVVREAVDTPERNAVIVEAYKQHAQGRRALAFCCDVDHACNLADAFKAAGVRAACIYGSMPKKERKQIMERHKLGLVQVLCNVFLLTEGYDDPAIDCILLARPTRSKGYLLQMIGRGLRQVGAVCSGSGSELLVAEEEGDEEVDSEDEEALEHVSTGSADSEPASAAGMSTSGAVGGAAGGCGGGGGGGSGGVRHVKKDCLILEFTDNVIDLHGHADMRQYSSLHLVDKEGLISWQDKSDEALPVWEPPEVSARVVGGEEEMDLWHGAGLPGLVHAAPESVVKCGLPWVLYHGSLYTSSWDLHTQLTTAFRLQPKRHMPALQLAGGQAAGGAGGAGEGAAHSTYGSGSGTGSGTGRREEQQQHSTPEDSPGSSSSSAPASAVGSVLLTHAQAHAAHVSGSKRAQQAHALSRVMEWELHACTYRTRSEAGQAATSPDQRMSPGSWGPLMGAGHTLPPPMSMQAGRIKATEREHVGMQHFVRLAENRIRAAVPASARRGRSASALQGRPASSAQCKLLMRKLGWLREAVGQLPPAESGRAAETLQAIEALAAQTGAGAGAGAGAGVGYSGGAAGGAPGSMPDMCTMSRALLLSELMEGDMRRRLQPEGADTDGVQAGAAAAAAAPLGDVHAPGSISSAGGSGGSSGSGNGLPAADRATERQVKYLRSLVRQLQGADSALQRAEAGLRFTRFCLNGLSKARASRVIDALKTEVQHMKGK